MQTNGRTKLHNSMNGDKAMSNSMADKSVLKRFIALRRPGGSILYVNAHLLAGFGVQNDKRTFVSLDGAPVVVSNSTEEILDLLSRLDDD